jgi:hypothetical protein
MSSKSVTEIYAGSVDFVDLYNQSVLTVARSPIKRRIVSKKPILVTTNRDTTDAISAYATLKQSEGIGVTVSDILASLNNPSVFEDIYGNSNSNYRVTSSYIRKDANHIMDKIITRIERANAAGTTVPMILSDDYFGVIAKLVNDIKDDMESDRRVEW